MSRKVLALFLVMGGLAFGPTDNGPGSGGGSAAQVLHHSATLDSQRSEDYEGSGSGSGDEEEPWDEEADGALQVARGSTGASRASGRKTVDSAAGAGPVAGNGSMPGTWNGCTVESVPLGGEKCVEGECPNPDPARESIQPQFCCTWLCGGVTAGPFLVGAIVGGLVGDFGYSIIIAPLETTTTTTTTTGTTTTMTDTWTSTSTTLPNVVFNEWCIDGLRSALAAGQGLSDKVRLANEAFAIECFNSGSEPYNPWSGLGKVVQGDAKYPEDMCAVPIMVASPYVPVVEEKCNPRRWCIKDSQNAYMRQLQWSEPTDAPADLTGKCSYMERGCSEWFQESNRSGTYFQYVLKFLPSFFNGTESLEIPLTWGKCSETLDFPAKETSSLHF